MGGSAADGLSNAPSRTCCIHLVVEMELSPGRSMAVWWVTISSAPMDVKKVSVSGQSGRVRHLV